MEQLYLNTFPYYLSIGCSYDEFWNAPAWVAAAYREADVYRFESDNRKMWIQGGYFHDAVSQAIAMALWNKKGKKPEGYMEHPIPFTERELDADKQRRIQKTLEFFMKGQIE